MHLGKGVSLPAEGSMGFGTSVSFTALATLVSLARVQPAAAQATSAPAPSAQAAPAQPTTAPFGGKRHPDATRIAPETIGAPDCFCHTFTADGKTVVFVRSKRGLFEAHLVRDRWSEARPLPFSGKQDVRDGDPFFTPDGSKLYFWSSRDGRTSMNTDLYAVERCADGWGVPRNLGPPVNNEVNEPFPAVAADGTLYFGSARPGSGSIDLFRARPSGDRFAEPENLGPAVNSPSWTWTATSRPTRPRSSSEATERTTTARSTSTSATGETAAGRRRGTSAPP